MNLKVPLELTTSFYVYIFLYDVGEYIYVYTCVCIHIAAERAYLFNDLSPYVQYIRTSCACARFCHSHHYYINLYLTVKYRPNQCELEPLFSHSITRKNIFLDQPTLNAFSFFIELKSVNQFY